MLVWLSRRPQPSPDVAAKARQARVLTAVSRVELAVSEEYAGERLDRFLAAVLPGHSRSQIQRLIKRRPGARGPASRARECDRPDW